MTKLFSGGSTKILTVCGPISAGCTKTISGNDILHKNLATGTGKRGLGILWVTDVNVVIVKQVECCGKEITTLQVESKEILRGVVFSTMITDHSRACCKTVTKEIVRSLNRAMSFQLTRLYSDSAVVEVLITLSMIYPVHAILLDFSI